MSADATLMKNYILHFGRKVAVLGFGSSDRPPPRHGNAKVLFKIKKLNAFCNRNICVYTQYMFLNITILTVVIFMLNYIIQPLLFILQREMFEIKRKKNG